MSIISKLVFPAITALVLSASPAFASSDASLTLTVATPSGATERLEFRSGDGWRFANDGGPAVVKVALSAESASADSGPAQPLAVFLDRPTGGTFVYLPEAGWTYLGRSELGNVTPSAKPTAMTLFIDGPSGFVYRYVAEQGWKFAGRVGDRKL